MTGDPAADENAVSVAGKEDLEYAKDLLYRARGLRNDARQAMERNDHAIAVQHAQDAIELGAKATMTAFGIHFDEDHGLGFDKESSRDLLRAWRNEGLPRHFTPGDDLPQLLLYTDLWARYRNQARYGQREFSLGADQLFGQREAELAVLHARKAWSIANNAYSSAQTIRQKQAEG